MTMLDQCAKKATKKWLLASLLLLCLLLCTGCAGKEAADTRSLSQIWDAMEKAGVLPPMILVDGELALDLYGIDVETCSEAVLMVSTDSRLADEVILLRAKDDAAAKTLKQLLDTRMTDKANEAEGYSPEQFSIIKKGKVLQSGTALALIVSPAAEQLVSIYQGK